MGGMACPHPALLKPCRSPTLSTSARDCVWGRAHPNGLRCSHKKSKLRGERDSRDGPTRGEGPLQAQGAKPGGNPPFRPRGLGASDFAVEAMWSVVLCDGRLSPEDGYQAPCPPGDGREAPDAECVFSHQEFSNAPDYSHRNTVTRRQATRVSGESRLASWVQVARSWGTEGRGHTHEGP